MNRQRPDVPEHFAYLMLEF